MLDEKFLSRTVRQTRTRITRATQLMVVSRWMREAHSGGGRLGLARDLIRNSFCLFLLFD